jgi:hypothetical protein
VCQKKDGEGEDSDWLGRGQQQASNTREWISSYGENDEPQGRGCWECDRVAEWINTVAPTKAAETKPIMTTAITMANQFPILMVPYSNPGMANPMLIERGITGNSILAGQLGLVFTSIRPADTKSNRMAQRSSAVFFSDSQYTRA